MTKGQKTYLIITSVIAAITVTVHLCALGLFLDIGFNSETDLAKGLSIVFLGLMWIICGGAATCVSLITDGFLFKVNKLAATIILLVVILVSAATFCAWLIIARS